MPTIDQLAPAVAAADTDELPVSQGGIARRLTRAQLLAGMQPSIALVPGTLLGRSSPGTGDLERISVGANLTLAGGVLTAAPRFSAASLPPGRVPTLTDLVPLAQSAPGGPLDAAVAYGPFMQGFATLSGIDLSRHDVVATAGPAARSLADIAADSLAAEAFGAVGDGLTDDSRALSDAMASGRPIRLGPRVYVVNGQWVIANAAVLIGSPGRSVLRRATQGPGAWIEITGASFTACGVVFDANNIAGDAWGVLVAPSCTRAVFEDCVFQGAAGAMLGHGLTFQSSPAATQHVVRDCEARGNARHGIWVQAVRGVRVLGCAAHDNAGYGICVDFNDPAFVQKARLVQVVDNACWGNARGISVGNFNQTNAEPPVWGNANPDVIGVLVASNLCRDNASYGIAASGQSITVAGNFLSGNASAGVLLNAASSRVAGNTVVGGAFGIDAGGSVECDISGNDVLGAAVGINPGGSRNVRVAGNVLAGNGWGITAYNVETDGHGANFGLATTGLSLTDNRISFSSSAGGGIYLVDGPQSVAVVRNSFYTSGTADVSQCLWTHTDSVLVRDNSWNNVQSLAANPVAAGGLQQLQVPDVLDEVTVTSAPSGVQSMVTQHQAAMAGQIGFIRVTNGGSGYTQASVVVAGSGSGAAGIAHVRDGVVIGAAVTNPGSGYRGATPSVQIHGDGQGAEAVASVGLVVPQGRRLRVNCTPAVRFARVGSSPLQDNWTLGDITAPSGSAVDWSGVSGGWRAVAFAPGDYLAPAGDGSLVVRSDAGDITVRPAGPGRLRVGSDAEPFGFVSTLGRGSPEGVVAAPPGSDYRNLDGGVGKTLWLKRSGTDGTGWAAIG